MSLLPPHLSSSQRRLFLAQSLLQKQIPAQGRFDTEKLLHTEGFCTVKLAHKKLPHRDRKLLLTESSHTGQALQSKPVHRSIYTQQAFTRSKLVHTEAFCTQKVLHEEAFTQRSFYTASRTASPRTENPLSRQKSFTQRSLYTERFYTQRAFFKRQAHTQRRI